VLRDPRYLGTTFVMLHGGYPMEREAIWLTSMKNVYLDSSLAEIVQYPSAFKDTLKMWLETFPDKITFGTDAFPYNEVWARKKVTGWACNRHAWRWPRRSPKWSRKMKSAKPGLSNWPTATCMTMR